MKQQSFTLLIACERIHKWALDSPHTSSAMQKALITQFRRGHLGVHTHNSQNNLQVNICYTCLYVINVRHKFHFLHAFFNRRLQLCDQNHDSVYAYIAFIIANESIWRAFDVITTTYGVTSDDQVVKLTTVCFQWYVQK